MQKILQNTLYVWIQLTVDNELAYTHILLFVSTIIIVNKIIVSYRNFFYNGIHLKGEEFTGKSKNRPLSALLLQNNIVE